MLIEAMHLYGPQKDMQQVKPDQLLADLDLNAEDTIKEYEAAIQKAERLAALQLAFAEQMEAAAKRQPTKERL